MGNALRTKPLEVKEQCDRKLCELQGGGHGEAMRELRARKKLNELLGKEDDK